MSRAPRRLALTQRPPAVFVRLSILTALAVGSPFVLGAQQRPTRPTTPRNQPRDSAAADSAAAMPIAGITVIAPVRDAVARIPGSVAVISTETIRAIQPMSANEVLRAIPGVHLQEEEGMGLRANIGIRGLDPDRSRTVLVLEDGVPVSLAPYGEPELYYSPPIDRMERVEVIKGSGSILFGPQTIGGVINYVTAEPTRAPMARATVQGGSAQSHLVRVETGGQLGAVRGRLGAFERRVGNLNGLDARLRDATAKVGWHTGLGDIGVKLNVYEERSNATYIGLTDSLYRVAPRLHPQPDDRLDVRRASLTASHAMTAGTAGMLRTTAYLYSTERNWMRRDYSYSTNGNAIRFLNSTGSRDRAFVVAGVEPRLRTSWMRGDHINDLDLGVRVHHERARDQYITGSISSDVTSVRDDERRTSTAVSAFAQQRLVISRTLSVTPGVRVEYVDFVRNIDKTRIRRQTGTGVQRATEDVALNARDGVTEVIPGIGMVYAPTSALSVFAGVHRGFSPPRTKDAFVFPDATLSSEQQVPQLASLQLDAERSWNSELGARITPNSWWSAEATLFLLDFSNQIIEPSLSSGAAAAATLANQGATRHEGVELASAVDIGALLGHHYSLRVEQGVTFVNSYFSRDRFMRNGAGSTVNVRGNALPYAPTFRAHGAVVWSLPRVMTVRLDALHVTEQFSDNFETATASANGRIGRIPAYTLLDASVRYTLPKTSGITLLTSVKNLTGNTYIASRRPEGIQVGAPRVFNLGVSLDY